MSTFPSELALWCRDHHGIVSVAALRSMGVSRGCRRGLIRSGLLIPLAEGVYRLASAPDTFHSRCAAACAADVSVVVSCTSAGRLWELRRCRTFADLHVVTARVTKPIGVPAVVHRTRALPDIDVVVRADGIRVTSPPRTVFDLAKHLSELDLESVIEQVLERHYCTVPTLYGVGRRLCHPGRPGSERFARVVGSRPAWRRPSGSHHEVVLARALERRGCVGFERQPKVVLADGSVIHPDLGHTAAGFFVEIDCDAWHNGWINKTYDKRRDRRVRSLGGWVERVDTDDIEQRLEDTVDDLLEIYRLWCGSSLPRLDRELRR